MLLVVGEHGGTVMAPAIGNAFFATVGVRLRYLPIRPGSARSCMRTSEYANARGVLGLRSTRPRECISPTRFNARRTSDDIWSSSTSTATRLASRPRSGGRTAPKNSAA
jgi:hypothetical protein